MDHRILDEISSLLKLPRPEIDLDATFTQLGGHSLSAISLVSACRRRGIRVDVESVLTSPSISGILNKAGSASTLSRSDKTRFPNEKSDALLQDTHSPATNKAAFHNECLTTAEAASRKEGRLKDIVMSSASNGHVLAPKKPERQYGKGHTTEKVPHAPLTRQSNPTTEMQLSLIHGGQKTPGTNIISYHETYRPEDIPNLKRAWKAVIECEPIFRTRFDLCQGKGRLVEEEFAPFRWSEIVVKDHRTYDACLYDEDYEMTEITTQFRVVTLPRKPPREGKSTVIWQVHHALIDGFSSALVIEKVRRAVAGLPIQPGPSFVGLAAELCSFQESSSREGHAYWDQQQENKPDAAYEVLLPAPSMPVSSNLHATRSVLLQVPLEKLSAYAQQSGITLASLYYAAWAVTLSRYSDSDDVVFGAVFSGRNLPLAGIEETVGPMINTLPVTVSLNREEIVSKYLRRVFAQMVDLSSFQWTLPEHGYKRLFSTALAMQLEAPVTKFDGITPIEKPFVKLVADVPLHVFLQYDGTVQLNYHANVYEKIDVESLGETFQNVLFSLLAPNDTMEVCLEEIISDASRKDLLRLGNCLPESASTLPIQEDLVTLFEGIAVEQPDAVAVEKGSECITYAEVDASATVVAECISTLVQPGDVICVHADRSINWIIAIYGVLKAGGVYCPLDEALPADLKDSYFLSASSCLFLVSHSSEKTVQPASCANCFSVEELLQNPERCSFASKKGKLIKRQSARPGSSAYLCFTSGSTGKPKGVICRHEGLVAFERDYEARLCARPGLKISQIMSPAFDGSIHEIFSSLCYGATLVLKASADPFQHLSQVDSAVLTPSIAKMFHPQDFPKLSTVSQPNTRRTLRLESSRLTHSLGIPDR